jgi:hypothetical protein
MVAIMPKESVTPDTRLYLPAGHWPAIAAPSGGEPALASTIGRLTVAGDTRLSGRGRRARSSAAVPYQDGTARLRRWFQFRQCTSVVEELRGRVDLVGGLPAREFNKLGHEVVPHGSSAGRWMRFARIVSA